VFVLQKNLSVALEPAMGVCGVFETNNGVQIDIPWPLEMDDYRQVQSISATLRACDIGLTVIFRACFRAC
jgi:hypothetical protein